MFRSQSIEGPNNETQGADVKTSTPINQARTGQMRAAANTHRALKQDEVKVNRELLENVLTSDNLADAWKQVKANKGAPGIDGMTIEDFPT